MRPGDGDQKGPVQSKGAGENGMEPEVERLTRLSYGGFLLCPQHKAF